MNIGRYPSNDLLLGVATNGTVHFWSQATGTHLRSVALGETNLTPLFPSVDGRWLLGIRADTTGDLYDLRSARRVRHLADFYYRAAFSPDSRWLAYGTMNSTVKLLDLETMREMATLEGHSYGTIAVTFSPDGELLATGGDEGDIRLWTVKTGKPLMPPLKGHDTAIYRLVFSSDGKTLLSETAEAGTRFWSVAVGQEMLLLPDTLLPGYFESQAVDYRVGSRPWLLLQIQSSMRFKALPPLAEIDALGENKTL